MLKREIIFALLEGRFEDAGEAIESKLQNLSETVGKALRGQDGVIHASNVGIGHSLKEQDKKILELFEMLAQRTKRIEALEEQYKEIYEMMASWETLKEIRRLKVEAGLTKPEPTVKEKIDTDKDGKPEGGLEPGDVISYKDRNGKVFGIFLYMDGDTIYADWRHPSKPYPHINFKATTQKEEVTFEFRPRFSERKER